MSILYHFVPYGIPFIEDLLDLIDRKRLNRFGSPPRVFGGKGRDKLKMENGKLRMGIAYSGSGYQMVIVHIGSEKLAFFFGFLKFQSYLCCLRLGRVAKRLYQGNFSPKPVAFFYSHGLFLLY